MGLGNAIVLRRRETPRQISRAALSAPIAAISGPRKRAASESAVAAGASRLTSPFGRF